ncbi:hypothetical protein BO78DRAFT_115551 [Aspergillus sclerotiicarbonarius CBS 121057]|uniref:Uncharacterized protein n=1 Tax=Aspergillus sclerotiicarbonarius (strain CBS 121057 / IBT 28362) TaxID=1448318 RepID=A0A319E8K4_ASPSB|nr:hypothetical protein BO78DRAFT_115551 [Aspergillus sclerotiicarbonarius CBS 121057]
MVARNQSALSAQHGSSDEDEVSATEGGPPGEAAQHGNTALSESVLSEESSIFNALRTNSGTEDAGPRLGPGCPTHGNADSRIAANMAMFIPLAPEATDSAQRLSREPKYCPEQKAQSSGWHPQLSLDSRVLSTDEVKAIVASPPDDSLKQHLLDALHLRKAVSLNDADDTSRTFKWPGNHDSPVSPVLPSYPPPARAPTPPGLPSFGTREAIYYSAQFPVRSATISGQVQQPAPNSARNACRRAANGTRPGSYGGMLRRLLSFSSSAPSQPKRQTYTVARAEDGTAVQGRFPYRQSGHGMNLARRLEDHPFHRTTVSTVQEDHVNIDGGARQNHRDHCDSKQEQADISEPLNLGAGRRMQRARPQIALNSLLPLPRPVLADSPQRPASANASLPSSRVDSFHTCASHLQAPGMSRHMETLDAQGTERLGDSAACFLAPTQSPPVSTAQEGCGLANDHSGPWLQSLRIVNSWFFCCLGGRNERDAIIYSNTTSNDTYVTARSHASNDSAAERPRPNATEDQAQSPRRWFSDTWMSLQVFASRNFMAMSPMPA